MAIRYRVTYGDIHGSRFAYVVLDTEQRSVAFGSDSKSEVIAQAQRLNGFPVDGSEQSYGEQVQRP